MQFLPNTNKSRLIHTEFKGFPLHAGLYCIDNNIEKTNHILALAVANKMHCYFIEIYSDIDFASLKFGQRFSYGDFSEIQAKRGAKGGKKGGIVRSAKYAELRIQAKLMHEQGMNKTQIAKHLGVTRMTIINWLGV